MKAQPIIDKINSLRSLATKLLSIAKEQRIQNAKLKNFYWKDIKSCSLEKGSYLGVIGVDPEDDQEIVPVYADSSGSTQFTWGPGPDYILYQGDEPFTFPGMGTTQLTAEDFEAMANDEFDNI